MTDEDPFEILGIPQDATPEQVRRAYLRRLPKHKPERDPQGFQRLRSAYELAVALTSEPWWAPSTLTEHLGSDAKSTGPAAPPAPDQATNASTAPAGQLDVADTAPELATESAARLAALAEVAAADGDAEVAVAHGLGALDLNRRSGGREGLDALIRTALLLQACGAWEGSRSLLGGLWAFFHQSAAYDAFDDPSVIVSWAAARELNDLPADFPPAVTSAIAEAARAGEPSQATDGIHAFVVGDRLQAARAAGHLKRHAPMLWSFYGHLLSGPAGDGAPRAWQWLAGWLLGLGLLYLSFVISDPGSSRLTRIPVLAPIVAHLVEERREAVQDQVQSLCFPIVNPKRPVGCQPARQFFEALHQEDCATASSRLDEVHSETAAWLASDVSAYSAPYRSGPLPGDVRLEMESLFRAVCRGTDQPGESKR